MFVGAALVAMTSAAAMPDRPQYVCLSGIGEGVVPTQAHIDSTLLNLSGAKGNAGGTRRLCMGTQWSVLNGNVTAMLAELDTFLALSLANDLPVSMSIDATQWWGQAEHLWNFWNASRPR